MHTADRLTGLDGLRGLAVLAVLVYHLDASWLRGGFLGVSLFFTLSGYLITTLLLREHRATGRVDVRTFWARRARRLLPAALLGVLLATVVGAAVGTAGQLRALPGDVAGSLAYVANWRFVATHTAYGAGYEDPSLLEHFWSLAIEEQFYVLYPLFFLLARRQRVLAPAVGALAIASALAAAVQYDALDTARTYFGTETRGGELLVGALLAMLLARRSEDPTGPRAALDTLPSPVATLLGAAALLATAGLWVTATPAAAWLNQGGFLLVGGASAALIAGAAHRGPLAVLLSVRPLVWLGSISYGVYVYHWPIFQALDDQRRPLEPGALVVLRLAPTLALAWASARWIEQPVRQGRLQLGGVQQLGLATGSALLLLGAALVVGDLADARAVARSTPRVDLGAAPSTAPPPEVVEPPRRVLVVGDSLLHQGLPTLRDRFARHDIALDSLGGPSEHLMFEQAAWLLEVAAALEATNPDVVLLESCCGFGSARRDELYLLADGSYAQPDTEATWATWQQLAGSLSALARSRGAATLWVLAPPAQTGGFYGPVEQRIQIANGIYRELASCRGDLGLVDWGLLAHPDGSYAAELPDSDGNLVKVRADDGLHFTLEGQALVADLTVETTLAHWQAVGGRSPAPVTDDGACVGGMPRAPG